jgi:hypothetical protein
MWKKTVMAYFRRPSHSNTRSGNCCPHSLHVHCCTLTLWIHIIMLRTSLLWSLQLHPLGIVTCCGCSWLRRRVLDRMIGLLGTLYTVRGTTVSYSAIAVPAHTLQFTVTHALGFSVITSRILATDLSQSHCNFKSHMRAYVPAGWSLETRLSSVPLLTASDLFFVTLYGPRRKHSLSVVEKACLQRRCIATDVIRLLLAYLLPRERVYPIVA